MEFSFILSIGWYLLYTCRLIKASRGPCFSCHERLGGYVKGFQGSSPTRLVLNWGKCHPPVSGFSWWDHFFVVMDFYHLLRSLSPRIELCDAPFKAREHSIDKGLMDWYYAFSCLGWTYWFLCCLMNDWLSTESCSFLMGTNFGPLNTIFLYWSGKILAFDTINQESLGIWWLLTGKQELNQKNDGFLRIDYCWFAMTVKR